MRFTRLVRFCFVGICFAASILFVGYSRLKKPVVFHAHLQGWYPRDAQGLSDEMQQLDNAARSQFDASLHGAAIHAMIVPHAGYTYSGDVAAAVYRLLDPTLIKRIIVLAPSHQVDFIGIALPSFDQYQTSIGALNIDRDIVKKLADNALCAYRDDVYQVEHSFEIQVPLIIHYLPQVRVVPLLVGTVSAQQIQDIAHVLIPFISRDTVVMVSSDFTHYGDSYQYTPFADHIQQRIMQLDSGALEAIEAQSLKQFIQYVDQTGITICGRYAIAILLALLEQNAFDAVTAQLISYKTSAHVTHTADTSVSYVGMVFVDAQPIDDTKPIYFNEYEKRALLTCARHVLEQSFMHQIADQLLYPIKTVSNSAHRGVFVTLKKHGQLRGCIGRITTDQPIYQTVMDMTRASAFQDSRFSPVTADEVKDIVISISVLTAPKPVSSYRDIIIGHDGIILTRGSQSALFLPTVAPEFGWDLQTTLSELSKKAGLTADAWQAPDVFFQTFEGPEFSE